MPFIGIADLNALGDKTKLVFTAVNADEEASVVEEIFAQVSQVYTTTHWISQATTPKLIQKIIAMFYVGWFYQKTYSEDVDTNNFGLLLIARGQRLIDGIIAGSVELSDVVIPLRNDGIPTFYPTDASSLLDPTSDDQSLGGPSFSMGTIW